MQNAQPPICPMFRVTYQKQYPAYINEQNPFHFKFKMPSFRSFSGEDSNVFSRDHIVKFSNHCVALEDNPNYNL